MKHLADGHSVVKKVLEFVVSIGFAVQCFLFQVKKVVKGEARKRRKDQGKFKKPMAAVLTGLNVKGREDFVEELVEGELDQVNCAKVKYLHHIVHHVQWLVGWFRKYMRCHHGDDKWK